MVYKMKKVISLIEKMEKMLCVVSMMVTFFIILIHIIGRYIFRYPLSFTEELSRYLFIYMVMISTSVVLRTNSHTRAEIFTNLLPVTIRNLLSIAMDLLCLFFLVIVIYEGFVLVHHTRGDISPALSIPIGIIYFAAPLSAIFMSLTLILGLIEKSRHLKIEKIRSL